MLIEIHKKWRKRNW